MAKQKRNLGSFVAPIPNEPQEVATNPNKRLLKFTEGDGTITLSRGEGIVDPSIYGLQAFTGTTVLETLPQFDRTEFRLTLPNQPATPPELWIPTDRDVARAGMQTSHIYPRNGSYISCTSVERMYDAQTMRTRVVTEFEVDHTRIRNLSRAMVFTHDAVTRALTHVLNDDDCCRETPPTQTLRVSRSRNLEAFLTGYGLSLLNVAAFTTPQVMMPVFIAGAAFTLAGLAGTFLKKQ